MIVFPNTHARSFHELSLGALFIGSFEGVRSYALKCRSPGEKEGMGGYAAVLGPDFPKSHSAPTLLTYKQSSLVLDFGEHFLVLGSTDPKNILFSLPDGDQGPWGLVVAGGSVFLRVTDGTNRAAADAGVTTAVYVGIDSSEFTAYLPENGTIIMAGWSIRLLDPDNPQAIWASEPVVTYPTARAT